MPDMENNAAEEKKRIKAERKQLKNEQKQQKKEAKKRARELSQQESDIEDEQEGSGVPVVLITFFIVLIWVAILAVLIKLDVGGFGSGVLRPLIEDVPVLNKVLPDTVATEQPKAPDASEDTSQSDGYGGYTELRDAVEQIRVLELELEQAQMANQSDAEELEELRAEVERLRSFEAQQIEFERIKNEFYNEVIYAERGPGPEAYQKYYEAIDPAAAEELYKQVVLQVEEDAAVQEYARAYSSMKPAQAAAIFEQMTDNLDLAAKILNSMSAEERGAILGAMDSATAARLTKIMDPAY